MRIVAVRILFVLCLALASVFSAAAQKAGPPQPKVVESAGDFLGNAESGRYTNSYFGMNMTFPKEYSVLTKAQVDVLTDAGVDLLKGENERNNKAFESASKNSVSLLVFAIKPLGTNENAALEIVVRRQGKGVTANLLIVENVRVMTGTGTAVLKKSLNNSRIGTNTFAGAEFDMVVAGLKVKHRMYVIMKREHSLIVGLTYFTDEQFKLLESALSTLTFAK